MHKKKNEKFIFLLLGVLIIFFLSKSLISNWNKVREMQISVDRTLLVISLLIYIINLYLRGTGWFLILKSLKISLSYVESIRIYYLSQLARYVPGGIVQFLGRIYLAKKNGISESITLISIILEVGFDILGSIVISLFFLFNMYRQYIPYFSIVFIVVIILITNTKLQNCFIGFFRRKFNKDIESISMIKNNVLPIFLFYTASWFIFGYSFSLFCNSFGIYGSRGVLISIFPSSWIVGFLSPFPGGIGIREGILKYFLSLIYSFPIPTMISLLSRVWLVIGELIGGIIMLPIFAKKSCIFHCTKRINTSN